MGLSAVDRLGRCKECKHHCKKCDEINAKYAAQKVNNIKMKGTSLCWCCEKAVPKKAANGEREGCSWSLYFQPVVGWDATEGKFKHDNGEDVKTYCVHSCPEFKRG